MGFGRSKLERTSRAGAWSARSGVPFCWDRRNRGRSMHDLDPISFLCSDMNRVVLVGVLADPPEVREFSGSFAPHSWPRRTAPCRRRSVSSRGASSSSVRHLGSTSEHAADPIPPPSTPLVLELSCRPTPTPSGSAKTSGSERPSTLRRAGPAHPSLRGSGVHLLRSDGSGPPRFPR